MFTRLTTVIQDHLVVAPGFFESVCQDWHLVEGTVVVNRPGQLPHSTLVPVQPGRINGHGLERVADDVTEENSLIFLGSNEGGFGGGFRSISRTTTSIEESSTGVVGSGLSSSSSRVVGVNVPPISTGSSLGSMSGIGSSVGSTERSIVLIGNIKGSTGGCEGSHMGSSQLLLGCLTISEPLSHLNRPSTSRIDHQMSNSLAASTGEQSQLPVAGTME